MLTVATLVFRFITRHAASGALSAIIAFCLLASGCAKTETALIEQRPAYQPPPAPQATNQLLVPKVTAPKLIEVEDAVRRVFKDAAVIDQNSNPGFIVGDFNGDESEDLAVVLKPAPGQLPAMNEEYPAWLLRDPFGATPTSSGHLRIEDTDTLLAVIHGYGANDWRDNQATQTYLLKNAAGPGLSSKSARDFLKENSGRKLPRINGDVITETVRGARGCLYYGTATYSWYDPKTFKGETQLRAFHGAGMR